MAVTLVPEEFTLVKFDAAQVRDLIATAIADTGFPTDVDVVVEVDEVLPHPLTASVVEIVEGVATLWFTGGCFESPQRATGLSVEHTKVELAVPCTSPRVGDKVEFVVGYSDTTVHLHEEIVAIRGGRIESIWRVAGRGKLK